MSGWKWLDEGPLWRQILFVILGPAVLSIAIFAVVLWVVQN